MNRRGIILMSSTMGKSCALQVSIARAISASVGLPAHVLGSSDKAIKLTLSSKYGSNTAIVASKCIVAKGEAPSGRSQEQHNLIMSMNKRKGH